MTHQTTTSSGPAVSVASLAKVRALSASSDAVSGASSGGQGGKSISRLAVALIIGGVLLVLLCALSFTVGSRMFALDRSIDGFLHPEANTIESKLIWAKRAPRTAAALLVGAALAVSGVLMQALSRNPLAEPGLLGVNSGAAASVVVGVGVLGCRPRSFSSGWRWPVRVWRRRWCSSWAWWILSRTWIRRRVWCSRVWR